MKIGVIGLGLIGGSIFKALKGIAKYDVLGVSSSVNEEGVSNDYNTLKECDLVFVCSPMNVTLDVLRKLDTILNESTIVTDVSSLKTFVSKERYNFKFIPSHPMAGTEHSGWENSFPELFEGAKWAITPLNNEFLAEQNQLEEVIKCLGAEPIITTPEEHDKAVALISHFPLIVAQVLCKSIKDNSLAQALAASGFRDTTRLALSNLEMANDMLNMNIANINQAYKDFQNSFEELVGGNYKQEAEEIKSFRNDLYN